MLTHCDLQIRFQYHENAFRLIRPVFDFESGGFLMDSKVIKGKWHHNETPPAYSYWTKPLSCKFSKWSYIVHTTFWVPKLLGKNKFFHPGCYFGPSYNKHEESKQAQCLLITRPSGLFSEKSTVDSCILPIWPL